MYLFIYIFRRNGIMEYNINLLNAEIVLKSKKKNNTYYMYSDKIVVCGTINKTIVLPSDYKIICFYDMYYVKDELYVVLCTDGDYDVVYIMDEENLRICKKGLQK